MDNLSTSIGKVKLRNPLILAAGILGSTYSTLNKLFNSVVNAVGLANPGVDYYCHELQNINLEVKYIVSCFGGNPEEFSQVIKTIDKYMEARNPPIAFELNLSCPHASHVGIAVGTDPFVVEEILKSVKKVTKIPLWVKLTPNITDITEIGVAAVKGGADALVAINTVKAMLIDIKTRLPILSNYRGGLSGSAIKPIGVRAIFDLYESLGSSIPLVGVGGISKWEDIIEYILAGANAVQFGSVLSFKDPKAIINHFREKLSSYLQQEEIDLDQLRGLAHE
jgi:dihydroorotate dehydrogenase (NAD+) catalytic subunit